MPKYRVFALDDFDELIIEPIVVEGTDVSGAFCKHMIEQGCDRGHIYSLWKHSATVSEDRTLSVVNEDGEFKTFVVLIE